MSDKLARVESGGALSAGFVPQSFNDVARISKALSEARGFVPREMIGNPNAIAAAIMTGMEIGIGPMQALRSIHVIDGRPMLSADLMLALAIRRGVRAQWLTSTAELAHLRLTRDGFEPHEHTFTIAEAKQAGLAGRGNWQKYPAAMLRARCLSAAMRAFCPDVIGPGVYVEGEIESGRDEAAPAPERAPEEPATIEAQLVDAEASCSAPTEQPSERKRAKRTQLGDCGDGDALAAWIEANGAAVMRHGEAAIAKVVQRAEMLGLEADSDTGELTARAWVERRLAAIVKGEAA